MDTMSMSIFESEQFGQIRGMMIDDEPWFVGKDVAQALGYSNTRDAIASHVDEDDKRVIQRSENATFDVPNRGLTVINESGLYSLTFSSRLPDAKKFKHWVTSEVLPSIRRDGGYTVSSDKNAFSEDWVIKLIQSVIEDNKSMVESQEVTEDVRLAMSGNLDFAKYLLSKHLHEDNPVEVVEEISGKPAIKAPVVLKVNGDAYHDAIVNAAKKKWTATEVAKDYGMTTRDFNTMLKNCGIQHKEGKVWRLNNEYVGNGYDAYSDVWCEGFEPSIMFWTKEGRLFLYNYLKEREKLPESGPIVEDAA